MLAKQKPHFDAFFLAVQDWLSGNVSGHLSSYMYTEDQNDSRWKSGHSSDAYYVARDEKATFDITIKELNILTEHFIDLGPGGIDSVTAKSLPIATKTSAAHYLPIDLSSSLAQKAALFVSKELNIQATPIIADFLQRLPIVKANTLITLLGLTLGNFETYNNINSLQLRLAHIFSNYRKAITNRGFFLVSFDANMDGEDIKACYNNPEFGGLVRSCLDRAIDTSNFDYDVQWTPDNYQLATGLRSNFDQIVHFNGEKFTLEKNEFLPILNSYRFPVSFVVAAAKTAGWKHRKTWSATGRVHYLLFVAE
jgi:uncharacterized SAM-dependent methyltransferase